MSYDDAIQQYVARLIGRGGPFELISDAEGQPPRFRRGSADIRSLFNRVKSLHGRVQLRTSREFTFGDVARASSRLPDPGRLAQVCVGVRDDDPFTWMAETMSTITSGRVAVPVASERQVEAFHQLSGQQLFFAGSARAAGDDIIASTAAAAASPDGPSVAPDARVPAIALFTSGTSGPPKPVFHCHEGILSGLNNMLLGGSISAFSAPTSGSAQIGRTSVLLMCPLSYIAGVAQYFLSFLLGSSIVIPVDRSADALAALILQNQITSIVGISRDQLADLISVPTVEKLVKSVRTIHVYGETVPADQVDALARLLPETRIAQGYGMTEAFGPIAAFVGEDLEGAVFWKLPSIEASVLSGSEFRNSGTGRLHVRGRNMMLGHNLPTDPAREYDWLDTGDEVELSPSGRLRILDRSSRLISTTNVRGTYLADVERHAVRSGARDAAAWVPLERSTKVVYLALVPTPELKSDLGRILTAQFGVEVRVLGVEAIPRRHGGKIDMDKLMSLQSNWAPNS